MGSKGVYPHPLESPRLLSLTFDLGPCHLPERKENQSIGKTYLRLAAELQAQASYFYHSPGKVALRVLFGFGGAFLARMCVTF